LRKTVAIPEELMKSRTTQEDIRYFESQGVETMIGMPEKGELLLDKIRSVDGLIVGVMKVDEEVFNKCDRLKVVASFGVGFDNIDIREATKHGVIIFNVPGLFSDAVANLTIGLMLSATRKLLVGDRGVRNGEWARIKPTCVGSDVQGKILGIVGLGSIGYAVARKCMSAFNMKVMVYDPFVSAQKATQLNIHKVEGLEELLSGSDVISIHCPLTDETRELIGARELSLMKPTAYLINTARGGVVDERALFKALKDRKIAGAAIDVMEEEPPEPDNPLLKLDNIIITPHIGASTYEGIRAVYRVVRENVCKVLDGNLPQYPAKVVNEDVLSAKPRALPSPESSPTQVRRQ